MDNNNYLMGQSGVLNKKNIILSPINHKFDQNLDFNSK